MGSSPTSNLRLPLSLPSPPKFKGLMGSGQDRLRIDAFLQGNSILVRVPGITQGADSSGHRLGSHIRILPPHKGLNRIKELPILQIYLLALTPELPVWSTVPWRAPKLGLCGLRPKCSSAHSSITLLSPLLGSRPAQGHSLRATWG